MSLYVLASGLVVADPQSREGAKGPFTTAKIRTNGDEAVLVSVIGFSAEAGELLRFAKGDAIAVSGRARLTSWTSRDGTEKHGLSVVAEQITGLRPRRSNAPRRTRVKPSTPHPVRDSGPALPADRVDDLWPIQ